MFDAFARAVVRIALRLFFRTIEVHGLETVPRGRPLVFAANHPNMVMDPFLVGIHQSRKVHFLGKSTLFSPAPIGWLLRAVGGIPVYRRADDPSQMEKNKEVFRECYAVLERGSSLGIFPEGKSVYAPRLLPIKTGLARIVLEAEAKNDFTLGVMIVPTGLNYADRGVFRSDVLLLMGDPIDPSKYFDAYKSDPDGAVHALTHEVEKALESVTRNLRSGQDARFIDQLRRIYVEGYLSSAGPSAGASRPADLKEAFAVDQGLIDAYAYFVQEQPERTAWVKRRIQTYLEVIDRAGLPDGTIGKFSGLGTLVGALIRHVPPLVLGLPVMVFGVIADWVPYRFTGVLVGRLATDLSELATLKLGFGGAFFLVWWGLLAAALVRLGGPVIAIAGVLLAPFAGLTTLALFDQFDQLACTLRVGALFGLRRDLAAHLAAARQEIIDALGQLTREWEARKMECLKKP